MAAAIGIAAGWIGSLFSAGAAAVGAGAVSAAAVGAGATAIASSVIYGAIAGAVVGGASAAIQGGDIVKGATKGALYGAATGAVMGGLSVAMGTTGAASGATATEGAGVKAAGITGEEAGLSMNNPAVVQQPGYSADSGLINQGMNKGSLDGNAVKTSPSWFEKNPAATIMAGSAISGLAQGLLAPDQEKIAKDTSEKQAIENQKTRDFEKEQSAIAAEAKKVEFAIEDLMRPLPSIAKFAETPPPWLSSERWPNIKKAVTGDN